MQVRTFRVNSRNPCLVFAARAKTEQKIEKTAHGTPLSLDVLRTTFIVYRDDGIFLLVSAKVFCEWC